MRRQSFLFLVLSARKRNDESQLAPSVAAAALGNLRARRPDQKYVLTALVQEWREANAERFGLLKDIHFPVLQQRAGLKLRSVDAWFERHATGFKDDEAVRKAAAQALGRILVSDQPPDLPAYGNN